MFIMVKMCVAVLMKALLMLKRTNGVTHLVYEDNEEREPKRNVHIHGHGECRNCLTNIMM